MVGHALTEYCKSRGDTVLSYDHPGLDISDLNLVIHELRNERSDAVINCAAWTDVDGCELDPEHAFAVNATGPENLAKASREIGAVLVTISTDYVFDGKKQGFYTQRDEPNPESAYGLSKLDGERRAQHAHARTIVVRSGFIFGPGGTNFLSTILDRVRKGERLKAISDSWGTPTYARDLVMRLRELAELDLPGVFHVVNTGDGASYEEFARAALEIGNCQAADLETVTTQSLRRLAPRPQNSRLKCLLSEAIGLAPLPPWRQALSDFINGGTAE
jgi:dTDP-4-dehydrorhamnose reductase